jgi:hypothetical protein
MAQRGRKSAAALATVTVIPGQRAAPPPELTPEQAAEWKAIVATKPAEWFNRDCQALLVEYCRHVVICRTIAQQIDAFPMETLAGEEGLVRFGKLGAMAERHSRMVASLSAKMRLAPSSRYSHRAAHTAASRADASGSSRPWDVG